MKTRLQMKKGRKSNYVKNFVNSEHHKDARILVLKRDNYQCKICNSKQNLEMHHISYHIKGNEINNLHWLITLCSECHQNVHNEINNLFNPKNPFKKAIL